MKYMYSVQGGLTAVGFAFLLLMTVQAAFADKITMKNGDRLTGTVREAKEGNLLLQTPYAGVSLPMDQIAEIETENPVTLRTQGREVLWGRLSTLDDRLRVIADEGREEVAIAWDQVRSINVPDAIWRGNIFAGGVHQSGNTDRLSVNFGADAVRRGLDDRFTLSFLYNYAEEDGNLSARDAFGALKYDYFFTERFYGLLSVELLKDRFKDLNLRAAVGPGLGYQVWSEDGKSLDLEAGVTWFSEDRIADEDDQWFTARLGVIFHYQFTPWLRFSDTFVIYPSLEDSGEYTLRNEATLVTSLGTAWSLRLGNIWQRDSDPSPDVKKDDFRTSLALQYSF